MLGLALFRWLPLTSTLLWWGAGALVMASVAVGGGVDDYDYSSVTETDFGTLYYYDTSYGLLLAPGRLLGLPALRGATTAAVTSPRGPTSPTTTPRTTTSRSSPSALALAALCLVRALSRRRPSPLAAAAGLTLGGLGIGWLALGPDEQAGVFSVGWAVVVILAVVQEIRARRNIPHRVRRRLRFVTAE